MDNIDIKIVQLLKKEFKGFQSGQLVLQFNGKSVNGPLINTLRRLAYEYVPTYAFCKSSIKIAENTSIFNNDYMRLRISQFTYPNFKHDVIHLPEKYWKNVDYSSTIREKFAGDKSTIEMNIKVTNNESENINVTTAHADFYENNIKVEKIDKNYPSLIIQLRPGESFSMNATGALGVGMMNDIWAAAANCYYEMVDDDEHNIKFTIESQGQLDEYEILKRSCLIVIKLFEEIKHDIGDNYMGVSTKSLEIKLKNNDFTVGGVLNEFLQMNKNIVFSGLSKPDLLIKEVVLKIVSVEGNPTKYILETIDHVIKLFIEIEKQLGKLNK